jgi:hypothetical protein
MENDCKRKQSEEILSEIYRNVNYAMESIDDILPEVEHEGLKEEIRVQHDGYAELSAKCAKIARDKGIEMKEPNSLKKVMMKGSIKMNAMMDGSRNHIAEMMLKGTVMGITALKTTLGDMREGADEEIVKLAQELLQAEEKFEQRLKALL